MKTADGVDIQLGGKYWVPTDDEFDINQVIAVKLCHPKKDDLFNDLHTVEVVLDDLKWHEFPSEMFSTRELCHSEIIARNERKCELKYNELEQLELLLHSLKNGGKDEDRNLNQRVA